MRFNGGFCYFSSPSSLPFGVFGGGKLEVKSLRFVRIKQKLVEMPDEVFLSQILQSGNLPLLAIKHISVRRGYLIPKTCVYHLQVEIFLSNLDQDCLDLGLEIFLCESLRVVNFVIHRSQESIQAVHDILTGLFR